jgi:hypothetical protein
MEGMAVFLNNRSRLKQFKPFVIEVIGVTDLKDLVDG